MLSQIDNLLNKVTMYRLMLYFLILLVFVYTLLGLFKLSPYNPFDIFFSLVVVIGASYITNKLFAKILNAQTNTESFLLTSLILVLITPIKFPQNLVLIVFVSVISMVSKYVLAYKKRHIFNPAAISLVLAFFILGQKASWWVSSSIYILPFVILGGLLIVRKIQREGLVVSFFISYFFTFLIAVFLMTQSFDSFIPFVKVSILDASLFFFMFIMLVEPRTSPEDKKFRIYYGVVAGVLYAVSQLGLAGQIFTTEAALCLSNLFAFFINPNYTVLLSLDSKNKLAENTYEFVFKKPAGFKFKPGQYLEWALPHKSVDSRGNRRYFSISSSPTEENVNLTTKFYSPSSSYKQYLSSLKVGSQIIASELSGNFTLPSDLTKPLAFVAGGIGITPFRSMIKYIIDKKIKVDIVLIYINKTKEDLAFADFYREAKENGIKTILVYTEKSGRLDAEKLKSNILDYKNRIFFLSGPQMMVDGFKTILKDLGVKKSNIKTDFFPGYSEN